MTKKTMKKNTLIFLAIIGLVPTLLKLNSIQIPEDYDTIVNTISTILILSGILDGVLYNRRSKY